MEFMLDSQVHCVLCLDSQNLVCGCLNGSLGILNLKKKQFIALIHTHFDKLLALAY